MLASRHRCQDNHKNGCAKTVKDDASNLLSVSKPHPQVEKTNKNMPHAPSPLAMHPRETYQTRTLNENQ